MLNLTSLAYIISGVETEKMMHRQITGMYTTGVSCLDPNLDQTENKFRLFKISFTETLSAHQKKTVEWS